jgi:hypothetical protein
MNDDTLHDLDRITGSDFEVVDTTHSRNDSASFAAAAQILDIRTARP